MRYNRYNTNTSNTMNYPRMNVDICKENKVDGKIKNK